MEPLYEEYLANRGTIVKPYYWLSFSLDCPNCPYHIRTGEEARVSNTEFYQVFGFLYGPAYPPTKQLTFYELKTSSGSLVQKGHASNCSGNDIHPESMLFETNGYLDCALHKNGSVRHIVLYSNASPCNEANHACIRKMYDFLLTYPDVTLSVYFSQLYHTEAEFPASAWNREALRSLASLWPQVSLGPISGGIWHSLLDNFVSGVAGLTVLHPILARRALADRRNADEINAITGGKPYFADVPPQIKNPNLSTQGAFKSQAFSSVMPGQVLQVTGPQAQPRLTPDFGIPVVFVLVPFTDLPPIYVAQNLYKPRNVVRHLNMPQLSVQESKVPRYLTGSPEEKVEITEVVPGSKEADEKKKRRK